MPMIDATMILDPYPEINSGTPTAITNSTTSANTFDFAGTGVGNSPGGSYGQLAHSSQIFGVDPGSLGSQGSLFVYVNVKTAFVGAGVSLAIAVQYAADNGSFSPATWVTAAQTAAIPAATLTTSEFVQLPLPPVPDQVGSLVRFLRLSYIVTGGSFSAGAVSSQINVGGLTTKAGLRVPNNYAQWNG